MKDNPSYTPCDECPHEEDGPDCQGCEFDSVTSQLGQIEALLMPIAEAMDGQDNQATANPIFLVRERKRIYGMDMDFAEGAVWLHDGEEFDPEYYRQSKDEYDQNLYRNFQAAVRNHVHYAQDFTDPFHFVGFIDIYIPVQPFFSREGAEEYIQNNKHNLTDPHIYVGSAYRNYEWQAIRKVLQKIQEIKI